MKTLIFDIDNTICRFLKIPERRIFCENLDIPDIARFRVELSDFWNAYNSFVKGKKVTKELFCYNIERYIPFLSECGKNGYDFLEVLYKVAVATSPIEEDIQNVFEYLSSKGYTIVAPLLMALKVFRP